MEESSGADFRALRKQIRKLERDLTRARERLVDYEQQVDRTQHLLNTRIEELETARVAIRIRTEELEESEERFRQLSEATFEAILVHDGLQILDCNDAATRLYRMNKGQLIGSSLLDRIQAGFHETVTDRLSHPSDTPFELIHVRSDGSTLPVESRSKQILFHGHPALVTAVRDITSHKALQEKLERLASTDPLTGVSNRRRLLEVGQREYFRARRYHQKLSAIMLDVDHFKSINDHYGHDAGDEALQALAVAGCRSLRANDLFARLGGEEFAALLPTTDLDGAVALAERLRRQIEQLKVNTAHGQLTLTISLGVSVLRDGDRSFSDLLYRADKALYAAKSGGRNRVENI